mgnify:CR=1 FL=1
MLNCQRFSHLACTCNLSPACAGALRGSCRGALPCLLAHQNTCPWSCAACAGAVGSGGRGRLSGLPAGPAGEGGRMLPGGAACRGGLRCAAAAGSPQQRPAVHLPQWPPRAGRFHRQVRNPPAACVGAARARCPSSQSYSQYLKPACMFPMLLCLLPLPLSPPQAGGFHLSARLQSRAAPGGGTGRRRQGPAGCPQGGQPAGRLCTAHQAWGGAAVECVTNRRCSWLCARPFQTRGCLCFCPTNLLHATGGSPSDAQPHAGARPRRLSWHTTRALCWQSSAGWTRCRPRCGVRC